MAYGVLLAALVVVAALSLLAGPGDLGDESLRATFLSLRGARVSGAMLAGRALGAAGGTRILSAIVQTISRFVDQGHGPDAAVALPRVHPVRSESESGERITLGEEINLEMTAERGWPPAVSDSLQTAGFKVVPVAEHASFGRVHLVARAGNTWQGVADLDWEGTAMSTSCNDR